MNRSAASSSLLLVAVLAAVQHGAAQDRGPVPQPAPGSLTAAWHEALSIARTHKAPILAFVLPPAGAADARRAAATRAREREHGVLVTKGGADAPPIATTADLLLRQIQLLRAEGARGARGGPGEPTDVQAAFALAVPVVASAAACGANAGETVVLLGADGKRIAGFAIDLLDRDAFRGAVLPRLLGPDVLAARRATVPPAVARDVERVRELRGKQLDEDGYRELQAATARVQQELPAAAPALIAATGETLTVDPLLGELEIARAPLGTMAEVQPGDACPPCGMAFVPPQLFTVLKLIGP